LGTCSSGTTSSCAPYVCGTISCKTSCSGTGDCVAGYECVASACVFSPADGGTDAIVDVGGETSADADSDTIDTLDTSSGGETSIESGIDAPSDAHDTGSAGDASIDSSVDARLDVSSDAATSPHCTSDGHGSVTPDGTVIVCAPYSCGLDGRCKTSCASATECADGYTCDDAFNACVPEASGGGGGGSCSTGARGTDEPVEEALVLTGIALLLGTRRRRAERSNVMRQSPRLTRCS
jgi:MYXO-CTERM domain-containing protein